MSDLTIFLLFIACFSALFAVSIYMTSPNPATLAEEDEAYAWDAVVNAIPALQAHLSLEEHTAALEHHA